MAFFDLPIEELRKYKPDRVEAADFDDFWGKTLAASRAKSFTPKFERMDEPLAFVDVFDVTFSGFDGQAIKGWFFLPKQAAKPLPCVVEYIGYGGGRGKPMEWLNWVNAGYANLVMDTRGQGSEWRTGDTPDRTEQDLGGQISGFMTRGIESPETYYYRRAMTDAVMAVDAAKTHPMVDSAQIFVSGGSQGGGLALAAAGLHLEVKALLADVPFLCHYRRATEITNEYPYQEIVKYCKTHRDRIEQVFKTLSYFDGVNFAARAKGKALFSVGLMDPVCPPSTVYAAFNHYAGDKLILQYRYNEHEGGGIYQVYEKIKFLKTQFK